MLSSAAEPVNSWHWLPPVEGAVVGALLNYRGGLDALGDALSAPSYQTSPKALILYPKPANTRTGHGHGAVLPADVDNVWASACLGAVVGRTATHIPTQRVTSFIAGYIIVSGLIVPHVNYYRLAIRHKCRDGSRPMGPWIVDRDDASDANALDIAVRISDEIKQHTNTSTLVRFVA